LQSIPRIKLPIWAIFRIFEKKFGSKKHEKIAQISVFSIHPVKSSCLVAQKRLRRMAKLDAANYFLRAMRTQMSEPNPSPFRILEIDELASALLSISLKGVFRAGLCAIFLFCF
jgi:hypothetical protein